jgi:hypothetical protein
VDTGNASSKATEIGRYRAEEDAMGFSYGIMRALAAAAMLLAAAPAAAQEPLIGHWRGDVTETQAGETTRYRMFVSIDADRSGRPVGSVSYSLECRGIWTGAETRGGIWRFDETITAGRTNCASHVEVELAPEGEHLRVRLHPVGYPEQPALAVLRRDP